MNAGIGGWLQQWWSLLSGAEQRVSACSGRHRGSHQVPSSTGQLAGMGLPLDGLTWEAAAGNYKSR